MADTVGRSRRRDRMTAYVTDPTATIVALTQIRGGDRG